MKVKTIAYWSTTVAVILELLLGAEWDLTHRPYAVQLVTHLGYPVYLLNILGIWKILAAITLVAPGFARLKEWAYAGIFFAMTGAVVSHAVCADGMGHIVAPLLLAVIAIASWALRPRGRTLGSILAVQANPSTSTAAFAQPS